MEGAKVVIIEIEDIREEVNGEGEKREVKREDMMRESTTRNMWIMITLTITIRILRGK
jgi:hypothetical protein